MRGPVVQKMAISRADVITGILGSRGDILKPECLGTGVLACLIEVSSTNHLPSNRVERIGDSAHKLLFPTAEPIEPSLDPGCGPLRLPFTETWLAPLAALDLRLSGR